MVMTAEEAISLVERDGIEKATKEVDVVTTGTFGAMCSSGAFINFGHSEPPIRMGKVWLNDVPRLCGLGSGRRVHRRYRASGQGGKYGVWRGARHRGSLISNRIRWRLQGDLHWH